MKSIKPMGRLPWGAEYIVANGLELVSIDRVRSTTGNHFSRCNAQRRSSGISSLGGVALAPDT
jgi:hypothetical protein